MNWLPGRTLQHIFPIVVNEQLKAPGMLRREAVKATCLMEAAEVITKSHPKHHRIKSSCYVMAKVI